MMARQMLVAGNWKMNDIASADDVAQIAGVAAAAAVDVAIFPPATLIERYRGMAPAHVLVGGQDCHAAAGGAFTGWLSAAMLRAAGAAMVIVGHSERRALAGERDSDVRAKAEAALREALTPIICVGESAEERERGEHIAVVLDQLAGSLPGEGVEGVVIAYEPVWAIGTGKVATPKDVAEMHSAIRAFLIEHHGPVGDAVRILYGGSVNGDNAAELFAIGDVDGALVGGASLSAAKFVPIIEAAVAAG